MTNDIVIAVSIAINACFGDGFAIYTESVEQGLKEPCFFVETVRSTVTRQLGESFYGKNMLCVQYFPSDKMHPVRECRETAERLKMCLDYITLDDKPLRGTDMSFEVVDGILNFFVSYNIFMRCEDNKLPSMEKIKTEVRYGKQNRKDKE